MKEKVSQFLKGLNIGKTPTEIGIALGKCYTQASSSVNGALKSLVKEGLVKKERLDGKTKYSWVKK